jgi:hypothetical protein
MTFKLIMVRGGIVDDDTIHPMHLKTLEQIVPGLKKHLASDAVIISTDRYGLPLTAEFLEKKLGLFPEPEVKPAKAPDLVNVLLASSQATAKTKVETRRKLITPKWVEENREVDINELYEIVNQLQQQYSQVILVTTFIETKELPFTYLKKKTGSGIRFKEIGNGEALLISESPAMVQPLFASF